ncbi:MAG: hypothetical protein ACJ75M_06915 [Actinomycetes bacterium]
MDATTLLITVYCLIDDWGWPAVGLTGAALVLNALMEEQQRPPAGDQWAAAGLRSRLPALALAAISFPPRLGYCSDGRQLFGV